MVLDHLALTRTDAGFSVSKNRGQAPLNRYGDRNLNTALHTVVQIRIRTSNPPATTSPAAPLKARPREIKRCLARDVARDLYRLLESGSRAA